MGWGRKGRVTPGADTDTGMKEGLGGLETEVMLGLEMEREG